MKQTTLVFFRLRSWRGVHLCRGDRSCIPVTGLRGVIASPVCNSYCRAARDLGTVQRSSDDSRRALSVLLVTKPSENELTSVSKAGSAESRQCQGNSHCLMESRAAAARFARVTGWWMRLRLAAELSPCSSLQSARRSASNCSCREENTCS
jgi:hypothetical protein